jgi:hypothetical protein
MLVQDMQHTMEANICFKQGIMSEEQQAKIFHQKMLCGDVHRAVRYLKEKEKGGSFFLDISMKSLVTKFSKYWSPSTQL